MKLSCVVALLGCLSVGVYANNTDPVSLKILKDKTVLIANSLAENNKSLISVMERINTSFGDKSGANKTEFDKGYRIYNAFKNLIESETKRYVNEYKLKKSESMGDDEFESLMRANVIYSINHAKQQQPNGYDMNEFLGKIDSILTKEKLSTLKDEFNKNYNLVKNLEEVFAKLNNSLADELPKSTKNPSKTQKAALNITNAIFASKDLRNVLLNSSPKEIEQLVDGMLDSMQDAYSGIKDANNFNMVNIGSDFAISSRLAMLGNPNQNLALAQLVKKLDNEKFAGEISPVIRSYLNDVNENNLYANIIGGYGKVRGFDNLKSYGFNLGYDKKFDNLILGVYLTYANSILKNNLIKNDQNAYQFGIYSRYFLQNHEFDFKVALNSALNKLGINVGPISESGKYRSAGTITELDYGYVFGINDTNFIKPFAGLIYSFSSMRDFDQKGDMDIKFSGAKTKSLDFKFATEFRSYLNDGSYFYMTPGIVREIYKFQSGFSANLSNTGSIDISGPKHHKQTYFTVSSGGQYAVNEHLKLNLELGAKLNKDKKYYNANLGLKYSF